MEKKREEQDQDHTKEEQISDDREATLNDQDPGQRQKENQNQQKDDPLAA